MEGGLGQARQVPLLVGKPRLVVERGKDEAFVPGALRLLARGQLQEELVHVEGPELGHGEPEQLLQAFNDHRDRGARLPRLPQGRDAQKHLDRLLHQPEDVIALGHGF
jgi:hypothetical protein